MEEGITLEYLHISPFKRNEKGVICIDMNYPMRYCAVDHKNKIAIDIENKLEYDYVETFSTLYLMNKAFNNLKEGTRIAIAPEYVNIENDIILFDFIHIKKKLEKGAKFKKGNEVLSNEKYLKLVNKTKEETVKVKKIGPKGK